MPKRLPVVVLISGNGSNLQALIDAAEADELQAQIVAVISNRPDAFGLERARRAGIAAIALDHRQFPDRASYDHALRDEIDRFAPGLLVLAGYMRVLTAEFVEHFAGRIVNIHPSLLPLYPGLHTHARVLEAGDREHGVTVHFVTEALDGGPPILQSRVPVLEDDDEGSLAQRVQQREHLIYPLAVRWFAEGRLHMHENQAWLDEKPLPPAGVNYEKLVGTTGAPS